MKLLTKYSVVEVCLALQSVTCVIFKENVSNQAEAPCLATSDSTARRVSTNVGCSKVGPTSNLISSSRTGPHVFLLPLIFLRVPLSPPLQSNPHPAAPRVPWPAAIAFLRSCYIGAARPGRRCCDDNSALLRPAAVGAASLQSGGDDVASLSGGGGAAYPMWWCYEEREAVLPPINGGCYRPKS
jgi:hypothetical protein